MAKRKKEDHPMSRTRRTGVAWADEAVPCKKCNVHKRRCEMVLWKQKAEEIEGVGMTLVEKYLCPPCAREKGL